jgi:hypothetical protein
MTEAEWFACTDSTPMLEIIRFKASDRKMRLIACACCRRIWHLLTDERSLKAVEMAEQFADGRVDRGSLVRARDEAREAKRQFVTPSQQVVAWRAACAAQDATRDTGRSACLNCMSETSRAVNVQDTNHCDPGELQQQAHILRCIFGNPFRLAILDATWLRWNAGTVVKIAGSIYEDGVFDRLPLLADALEDAGCTDADILNYCRGPGPHVRGCWVVDLLLNKS